MKAGWKIMPLGSVCAFDKVQGIHRNLPYVGLEHIESQTARFSGSIEPQSVKSSTFRFSTEHILYGRLRPYLNKVLAPDFEGHCSTEIFPIKPGPALLREYLLYWFIADETVERINGTCTGARMPRANMQTVMGFDFPLPPLPEQRRIVGILDEAMAAIATAKANTEANLANARAVFDSRLHEVFSQRGDGWVERRLGELIEVQNGFAFRSNEYAASGHFLIRIGNVQDGSITLANPQYVDLSDPKLKRFELDDGDVLISLTGNIGRVAIIRNEHLPAALNQRVARITTKEGNVDRDFIFRFLSSRAFREGLQEAGHGAAQQNVSTKEIGSVVLHIPNLNAQRRIADELDSLATETQRLESIYRRKLEAMEALKKSLLHAAFEGEL